MSSASRLTYKALGALLEYPGQDLVAALGEIEQVLESGGLLEQEDLQALKPLLQALANENLYDLQESYVDTFDRGRATCLNLFEHVHGESRDRGQAMVDLTELYAKAGLELSAKQLPDYLPAVLEYLSLRPEEAAEMLSDCGSILQGIGAGLARRESPYVAVLRAVLRLAGKKEPDKAISGISVEDDYSAEAIDRVWEEAPVRFMGGCLPQQAASNVVQFYKGRPS